MELRRTRLARGQAPESILGATILATRLAATLGLPEEELVVTYFVSITRGMGCMSTSMDAAPMAFGNDLAIVHALNMADFTDPQSIHALDTRPLASMTRVASLHRSAGP